MTRRRGRTVRAAIVGEDRDVSDLVGALVRKVADDVGVSVRLSEPRLTHGCRPRRLGELVAGSASESEFVVIATDAAGAGHRSRSRTYRSKARSLRGATAPVSIPLAFAVAEPCAEAWLMGLRRGFIDGLSAGLGMPFRAPSSWPSPRSEREAKQQLGELISVGTGGEYLARSGFEFVEEIVTASDLTTVSSDSLRAFLTDLPRLLAVSGG